MPIRNFCIIAHIDHGKSTLADRLIEITGTLEKREMKHEQMLDNMDLERERGITIKLTPVRMEWKGHELNLIDTPGHVDFQYEVSRSLASVEGAILVVDATQGIEAQTLSNLYLALHHDLAIIPVLNKIDLPSADVAKCTAEIVNLIGCKPEDVLCISAKMGTNVPAVLDAVLERIPEPKKVTRDGKLVPAELAEDTDDNEIRGLIFDSQYDTYRGVVVYLKLFSGSIKRGQKLTFLHSKADIEVLEVGCFRPKYEALNELKAGEIGYVVTGLREIRDARVGDTLFFGPDQNPHPIEGFSRVTPFVYAGVYPVETDLYPVFKDALEKLMLNDSAVTVEPEVSPALGHGFRCGFLGLLHMDIVKERLWREFSMDVIVTSPQVTYKVIQLGDKLADWPRHDVELRDSEGNLLVVKDTTGALRETGFPRKNGTVFTAVQIRNPQDLPDDGRYERIEEPIAKVEILTPVEYVGGLMQLAMDKRGKFTNQSYLDVTRTLLSFELPMAEIIQDFYDELKSRSQGYASMSYEFLRFQPDDLVKVDFAVAGEPIEALSLLTHRDKAHNVGAKICEKLKNEIPKEQFAVAIQAVIGGKVVARETISALRKDVTAKLYGGDVSRKRKLLEKQKEGKKKLKQFGRVSIPSETFINILKRG